MRVHPRQHGGSCAWCSCTSPSHPATEPVALRKELMRTFAFGGRCTVHSAQWRDKTKTRHDPGASDLSGVCRRRHDLQHTPDGGKKILGQCAFAVLANTPPRLICSPCQPTAGRTVKAPSRHLFRCPFVRARRRRRGPGPTAYPFLWSLLAVLSRPAQSLQFARHGPRFAWFRIPPGGPLRTFLACMAPAAPAWR